MRLFNPRRGRYVPNPSGTVSSMTPQRHLTEPAILGELAPTVADNLNRHLHGAKDWNPHDYVPWSRGQDFAMLGGDDWEPEQSKLGDVARASLIIGLLTEDNLPTYHRSLADKLSLDEAWGEWVNRWTAEEDRHAIAIRDFLVVTRAVDPVKLEQDRMAVMSAGLNIPTAGSAALYTFAYSSIQELATRISHRNTGLACEDPVADKMLQRIAADENMHMLFFRNLAAAGLDLTPDQAIRGIADVLIGFRMPGAGMPDFRRNSVLMAKHGVYDLRQHKDEVVVPLLRHWKVFERDDFGADGEQTREELAAFVDKLEAQAVKFEEMRDRALARESARRDTTRSTT